MNSTENQSKKKKPILVISPQKKWIPVNFSEVWEYRELLVSFISRDIKIRYRQTILGFLWVILQPLFMVLIFTFFFGGLAKIPSDGLPYPVFVLAALLPWTLFAEGLTRSTHSMVANAGITTKVYFPRLILPLSGVISPIIDFIVAMTLLVIMMAYFRISPTVNILALPVFVFLGMVASLGIGLWISALNIRYRDFGYTLPFLIQLGFFASPIVYPASLVPESLQYFYRLNPMVGIIEGFRWALFGTDIHGEMIIGSILVILFVLISGSLYFRRMELDYADVV